MSMMHAQWLKDNQTIQVLNKNGEVIKAPLINGAGDNRFEYIEGSSFDFTIDFLQSPDTLPNNARTFIGHQHRVLPDMYDIVPITAYMLRFAKGDKVYGRAYEKPISDADAKAMAFRMGHDVEFIGTIEQPNTWVIEPGLFYFARTFQKVNIPLDIAMLLNTRTSMFRGGLSVDCTWANPNYQGELFVGIRNMRSSFYPALIQKGARFITARFFRFDFDGQSKKYQDPLVVVKYTDPYDCSPDCVSAWQGGKGTSAGEIIGAY